jgi:hypothetical protein
MPPRPHVHHRCPGKNRSHLLVTLCPRCHTRVHRLAAIPRRWLPELLVELWAEQHPSRPRQQQLPFAEALL